MRAFAWFLGNNDLSISLIDLETGSCCDGLHPDRVNENRGGESVVSYLLGLAQIRLLAQFVAETGDVGMTVSSTIPALTELPQPRHLDTKHVLQATGIASAA